MKLLANHLRSFRLAHLDVRTALSRWWTMESRMATCLPRVVDLDGPRGLGPLGAIVLPFLPAPIPAR
jgi:hypothetical protein